MLKICQIKYLTKFHKIFPPISINPILKHLAFFIIEFHKNILLHLLIRTNDPIFAKAFVINPLESKTVINTMRRIPDNLRDGKMVVKRFIRKVKDNIPYDRAVSVQRTHLILDSDSIIKYLIGEINRMLIQSLSTTQ